MLDKKQIIKFYLIKSFIESLLNYINGDLDLLNRHFFEIIIV